MPTRTAELVDAALWLRVGGTVLHVAVAVALALAVLAVVGRLRKRWVARAEAGAGPAGHRARVRTLADLLGSVARYAVWTVTLVTVLSEVGVEIGPILASAGVAGLAIGFGAQTLVKDVISGFFLLFDETIGSGDLITFNGQTATVESVGLRLIQARKFDGELLMIPAGELRVFGNKSVGFARAVVDVGLSYEQDTGEALAALDAVAREWAATDAARAALLDEAPEVQGLMALGEATVQARVVVRVRSGAQFEAERDLRRRIKDGLAERGIAVRSMPAAPPAPVLSGGTVAPAPTPPPPGH